MTTKGRLKEIESLLRDNNLNSLWSREEVRPSLDFLLSLVRKQQRVIEKKDEGLTIAIRGFTKHVPDTTYHDLLRRTLAVTVENMEVE